MYIEVPWLSRFSNLSGCQMKGDLKACPFNPFSTKYLLLLLNSLRFPAILTIEHCSTLSNTDCLQQRFGPKDSQKPK